MQLAHTFSLPNETYPLRELFRVLGCGRDTNDEAEPKLVLTVNIKTVGHFIMVCDDDCSPL